MTPRVIHLIESLEVGGAEKLVCDFAAERGPQHTSVACLRVIGTLGETLQRSGFHVDLIGMSGPKWRTVLRLRDYLRREGPDILHTHNLTAHLFGAPAARLVGIPVIQTKHGELSPGRGPAAWFNRWMIQKTYVVSVSQGVTKVMEDWMGPNARPVRYIANGISLAAFKNLPSRAEARRKQGWPEDALIVGIVARLIEGKGHLLLVEAMARVPQALLVIAGDGPMHSRIEARVRELNLESRVVMMGEQTDVPGILAALDVFCLPSDTEGMPVTLLEAMAAARPVVITSVGAIPTVVEDGVSGLLIPPRDLDALVSALRKLADDPALRARMGEAGNRRVDPAYSVASALQAYEELYREITSSRAR